jgi:hypothetical protein
MSATRPSRSTISSNARPGARSAPATRGAAGPSSSSPCRDRGAARRCRRSGTPSPSLPPGHDGREPVRLGRQPRHDLELRDRVVVPRRAATESGPGGHAPPDNRGAGDHRSGARSPARRLGGRAVQHARRHQNRVRLGGVRQVLRRMVVDALAAPVTDRRRYPPGARPWWV